MSAVDADDQRAIEQMVAAALFYDPSRIEIAAPEFGVIDILNVYARQVGEAVLNIRERGETIDRARLEEELTERGCQQPYLWTGEITSINAAKIPAEQFTLWTKHIAEWARARREAWERESAWERDLATALADVQKALGTSRTSERRPLFALDATRLLQTAFTAATWLITGLVTMGGIVVFGAEPKTIKTWLALEMSIAIATGTKACGEFNVKAGRAAYFFAEDQAEQVRNRVRALLAGAGRKIEEGRLFLQPRGMFLDILKDEDLAWIVASARRLPKLDFLVLDPLRDVHGGEEDKSDSMRDVMRRLRVLGELLGCNIGVPHHTPKATKDNSRRRPGQNLRGSSAIHGSIDSGLYIESAGGDGRNLFKAKVASQIKGGRSAGAFALELLVTDDEHGQATCAEWTFSRASRIEEPETADDELRAEIIKIARKKRSGFESRTKLYEAVGGNKQEVMSLIGAELEPSGGLEYRDGRIHAKASDE